MEDFWKQAAKMFFGWDLLLVEAIGFVVAFIIMWLFRATEWCIVLGAGITAAFDVAFEILACKGDQTKFNTRRLWGCFVGIFVACIVGTIVLMKNMY